MLLVGKASRIPMQWGSTRQVSRFYPQSKAAISTSPRHYFTTIKQAFFIFIYSISQVFLSIWFTFSTRLRHFSTLLVRFATTYFAFSWPKLPYTPCECNKGRQGFLPAACCNLLRPIATYCNQNLNIKLRFPVAAT